MANRERRKLTSGFRFNFSDTSKNQKPMIVIQLAALLLFAVAVIVYIVQNGVSSAYVVLLIIWAACAYFIIQNAYRAFNPKAAEKARQNAPEFELKTPVPESEKDKQ